LRQRKEASPFRSSAAATEIRKSSPSRPALSQSKAVKNNKADARQSPRKKSALDASLATSSSLAQAPRRRQASFSDVEESDGNDHMEEELEPPLQPPPVALSKASIKAKASKEKRKEYISEEDEEEGEEEEEEEEYKAEIPKGKKKNGILNRAKKVPEVKNVKGKRLSKAEEEEERRRLMELDVDKTPMLLTKSKKVVKETYTQESSIEATPILLNKTTAKIKTKQKDTKQQQQQQETIEDFSKTPLLPSKRNASGNEKGRMQDDDQRGEKEQQSGKVVVVAEKKKKRRMLKQTGNIAHRFLDCNGDAEGDLDPQLNLPLQLSPIKADSYPATTTTSTTLGTKTATGAGAVNRIFGGR
jgi:hypothetical protein